MTSASTEPGVFVPVAIDAIREIEGVEMVRVTYFVVTSDAPGPGWEVDLPELTEQHGVSVLGISGIVYRAIHAGAEYEGRRRGLFIDPEDISSIFGLEEEGSPLPHHGGRNGVFDPHDSTPWLDSLSPKRTRLVMSSHVVPHGHPHPDVVGELAHRRFVAYRTDRNYHVTLTSTGDKVSVGYNHASGRLPR